MSRSDFPPDLLAGEPPLPRPAPRRRPGRLLVAFCLGVAATLGWQSYGDAAREIIANSSPQLSWLAPQAAAAQTAGAAPAVATAALDPQELKTMALGLATVRQRVDQLAAQVAAGQQQITRDFTTKLQAAEQDILEKIPAPSPPAAPPRRPAPAPAAPPR